MQTNFVLCVYLKLFFFFFLINYFKVITKWKKNSHVKHWQESLSLCNILITQIEQLRNINSFNYRYYYYYYYYDCNNNNKKIERNATDTWAGFGLFNKFKYLLFRIVKLAVSSFEHTSPRVRTNMIQHNTTITMIKQLFIAK